MPKRKNSNKAEEELLTDCTVKCNICNKTRIKSKEKVENPDKIATLSAKRTIKESTKQNDPHFYSKTVYVDLTEIGVSVSSNLLP